MTVSHCCSSWKGHTYSTTQIRKANQTKRKVIAHHLDTSITVKDVMRRDLQYLQRRWENVDLTCRRAFSRIGKDLLCNGIVAMTIRQRDSCSICQAATHGGRLRHAVDRRSLSGRGGISTTMEMEYAFLVDRDD